MDEEEAALQAAIEAAAAEAAAADDAAAAASADGDGDGDGDDDKPKKKLTKAQLKKLKQKEEYEKKKKAKAAKAAKKKAKKAAAGGGDGGGDGGDHTDPDASSAAGTSGGGDSAKDGASGNGDATADSAASTADADKAPSGGDGAAQSDARDDGGDGDGDDNDDDGSDGDNGDDDKDDESQFEGLTPAQKKKLRAKLKKKRQKEKEKKKKDKKDKKGGASGAKKALLEKIKREKEEREAREAAEAAALAEAERLAREEEEREREMEAIKERQRAEAKARQEELKRQGKVLSKKERARQAANEAYKRQLVEQGLISADVLEGDAPKAPVVYKKKRKKPRLGKAAKYAQKQAAAAAAKASRDGGDGARGSDDDGASSSGEDDDDLIVPVDDKFGVGIVTGTGAAAKAPAPEASWMELAEESDDGDGDGGGSQPSAAAPAAGNSDAGKSSMGTSKQERREKTKAAEEAEVVIADDELRSPICCVLGHVDVGKTKLLDKIRRSNVQDNEAGGITQQIGATFFPTEAIEKQTRKMEASTLEHKIPGLLIIDTPGHESFANLRTRGSSMCDIAVLVVDIMHSLEPQTIESINLLKKSKTPFVVALNKVDRLYDWTPHEWTPFRKSFNKQPEHTQQEFESRLVTVKEDFAAQGLNSEVYFKNKDVRRVVSLVPTSAHTGEGIPDLLALVVQLTQTLMGDRLLLQKRTDCTVLEVKKIEGLGTTIDVILLNGHLRAHDRIVVCSFNGVIDTQIKALLTPQPLKELRVKTPYQRHNVLKAAMGVKIAAPDLEHAVAGTRMMVVRDGDDAEAMAASIIKEKDAMLAALETVDRGVYVKASTLGALEALMDFMRTSDIPVANVGLGPVTKRDVTKASIMLQHADSVEYAVILAFDVPVVKDAATMAADLKIKIFTADIIYHLFDAYTAHMKALFEARKAEAAPRAVFPCVLRPLPECLFRQKDPLILGVKVIDGILKIGTPLCVPTKKKLFIGRVLAIEQDNKPIQFARKGRDVAVSIDNDGSAASGLFGRHFDFEDDLYSEITRDSIDTLKEFFKDEMTKDDWKVVIALKKTLGVQ